MLNYYLFKYLARSYLTFVCKMVVISNEGWIKWSNTYSSRKVYDDIPEKVMKLCNGPNSAIYKFEKLVQNKNPVLLARATLGKKCQATFFI